MRDITELLKMQREDMTQEEEIVFVNHWFNKYEIEGFSKVFCSPFDLNYEQGSIRNGEKFKVIGRVKPYLGIGDIKDDETDLETLPLWNIQFEDGTTMAAYPEEIIPSEIKENIWRESDEKYLPML